MKILSIFDFDDTLIHTPESRVRVFHSDGRMSSLTSSEYAQYRHQSGDKFDYGDFNTYPRDAVPIAQTFIALDQSVQRDDDVIILTARNSWQPVRRYIMDMGYDVYVAAVGHPSASKKAKFVMNRLKGTEYDYVQVFEDNASNIRAIKRVVDRRGVYFRSVRVHAGTLYPHEELGMKKKYPPGAGTVVVRPFGGSMKVILLQNFDSTWDLPKGRIDPGESPFMCSRRETREEAAISELRYRWGRDPIMIPNIHFYLAETAQDPRVLPNPEHGNLEHTRAVWCDLNEAYFLLPPYLKPVLEEAIRRMTSGPDSHP